MKKNIFKFTFIFALGLMMTSCYTFTATIGKGPQTGVKIVQKNHYLVNGLAPIYTANVKEMAGGATDYSITISHSFLDGLLNGFTSGFYTPTTVTVTK
jgi:hypothetical protein